MTHFSPWRQSRQEMVGELQDYAIVNLPLAPENEEDWSSRRWALEHLPQEKERDRILRSLLAAEIDADVYLEQHEVPGRPAPDWLNWEDDE